MTKQLRRSALVLVTAAAMTTAVAVPASADNNIQDGLVNLAVGRITVTDVNVGVAAQVAAAICGLDVGPIAVIGLAVDAGTPGPVLCTVVNQPVQLVQN
jgi:hypothetical protein